MLETPAGKASSQAVLVGHQNELYRHHENAGLEEQFVGESFNGYGYEEEHQSQSNYDRRAGIGTN